MANFPGCCSILPCPALNEKGKVVWSTFAMVESSNWYTSPLLSPLAAAHQIVLWKNRTFSTRSGGHPCTMLVAQQRELLFLTLNRSNHPWESWILYPGVVHLLTVSHTSQNSNDLSFSFFLLSSLNSVSNLTSTLDQKGFWHTAFNLFDPFPFFPFLLFVIQPANKARLWHTQFLARLYLF